MASRNHSEDPPPSYDELCVTVQPRTATAAQPWIPTAPQPRTVTASQPRTATAAQSRTPTTTQPKTVTAPQPRTATVAQSRTPTTTQPKTSTAPQPTTPTAPPLRSIQRNCRRVVPARPEAQASNSSQAGDSNSPQAEDSKKRKMCVIVAVGVVVAIILVAAGIAVYFARVSMATRKCSWCPENCSCRDTKMDCRSTNLNYIPTMSCSYVLTDLSGNNISNVSRHAFSGANGIEILLLNNSNLMIISEKAFYGLKRIISLDLSHNKIHTLSEKAFSGMSFSSDIYGKCQMRGLPWNECYVNLKSNPLQRIEKGAFQDCSELRVHIGLTDVRMRVESDAFMTGSMYDIVFDSIKELHLETKAFNISTRHITIFNSTIPTFVSGTFSGLNTLQSLQISNCSIELIERDAFGGISFNEVSEFPSNITIEHSNISSFFPRDTFQGSNMKQIIIQKNKITGFEAETFQKLTLDKLVIMSNFIWTQVTTNAFSDITEVREEIQFDGNNMTIHSDSFKYSRNINLIRFSREKLNLSSEAFSGIDGLNSLVISNCEIEQMGTNVFGRIKFSDVSEFPTNITIEHSHIKSFFPQDCFQGSNMRQIIIRMNHMKGFEAFAFQRLDLDKILIESNTYWNHIKTNSFSNIKKVQHGIYFQGNRLSVINSNSFENSTNITAIKFSDQTFKLIAAPYSFKGLKNVDSIEFRNISSVSINSKAFSGITSLKTLLFDNKTKISYFDKQAVEFSRYSIGSIQLLDYPIQCDCDAMSLAKMCFSNGMSYSITCNDEGSSKHYAYIGGLFSIYGGRVVHDYISYSWKPQKPSLPSCNGVLPSCLYCREFI